ncbi:MAG: hypothetical protein IPM23_07730 [Candidatus Melainabacteria bacterium]|nr:hypothetical protein [Candidatus Melainabacteria bacterium]
MIKGFLIATVLSSFTFVAGPPPALAEPSERALEPQIYPERGCPVDLVSIRSVLEVDPFGAPLACKIYTTYKNNSTKPISAVKFKFRFVDAAGKDKGTFHGGDNVQVLPGMTRAHKWRRDVALSPVISGLKIRVLRVKFGDGSGWHSIKTSPAPGEEPPPPQPGAESEIDSGEEPGIGRDPQQGAGDKEPGIGRDPQQGAGDKEPGIGRDPQQGAGDNHPGRQGDGEGAGLE